MLHDIVRTQPGTGCLMTLLAHLDIGRRVRLERLDEGVAQQDASRALHRVGAR